MEDLRTPISDSMKAIIAKQFDSLPSDKRGALLIVADLNGNLSAHLAAKIDDHWKVAFEAGKPWQSDIYGWAAIEAAW